MSASHYVDYYAVLGLEPGANPGEIRKTYRKKMKDLVAEIASAQITNDRRESFLLDMAKMNAALYVLRDKEKCEAHMALRGDLISLEEEWRGIPGSDPAANDRMRKAFDGKVKQFLSVYVEEAMLEAGRDKECVEASNWNAAHERYATRILRLYRHNLYHDILERLPYYEVTTPSFDWDERARTVAGILSQGAA